MNTKSTNNLIQTVKSSSIAKLLLVTASLQIAVFILWFVPTLNISAISSKYYAVGGTAASDTTYSAVTNSYAITNFFEGILVLNLMFIALMLVSLFFLVKPVLFNQLEKPNKLVLPKITSLVTLGLFLILFFTSKADLAQYADIGAICRLNFGGWLFIIFNVAILILGVEVSYKIKVNKIMAYSDANNETTTQ